MNRCFLGGIAACIGLIFCRVGAADTSSAHSNVMQEVFHDEHHGEVPLTPVVPVGGDIPSEKSLTPDSKAWQKIQSLRNLPRPKASHGKRAAQFSDEDQFEKLTQEFEQATLANNRSSLQNSNSHPIKNNSDQVTK